MKPGVCPRQQSHCGDQTVHSGCGADATNGLTRGDRTVARPVHNSPDWILAAQTMEHPRFPANPFCFFFRCRKIEESPAINIGTRSVSMSFGFTGKDEQTENRTPGVGGWSAGDTDRAETRSFPVQVYPLPALEIRSISLPARTSNHCAPVEGNSLQNRRARLHLPPPIGRVPMAVPALPRALETEAFERRTGSRQRSSGSMTLSLNEDGDGQSDRPRRG